MRLGDLVRISDEAAQFARLRYKNQTGIVILIEENVHGRWTTILWPGLKPISMPDDWIDKVC